MTSEQAWLDYQIEMARMTEALAGVVAPATVATFLVAVAGSVARGGNVSLDDSALRHCFDRGGDIGESDGGSAS